ncbi:hypothetical protein WG66_009072 [Moniliophthora roreri]|nr:hypothetical protein WG66_009072 [Moniliophthora roreri]
MTRCKRQEAPSTRYSPVSSTIYLESRLKPAGKMRRRASFDMKSSFASITLGKASTIMRTMIISPLPSHSPNFAHSDLPALLLRRAAFESGFRFPSSLCTNTGSNLVAAQLSLWQVVPPPLDMVLRVGGGGPVTFNP